MSNESQSRFGPYEIIAPLGAGGMGEVYRAWDPRLHRDVALKLLPDNVAQDPARRRRFLEEARAAGALNHPNIVAVYDVGIGEETPYIVSELLDGRQLRQDIERGPMPVKRLLDVAAQMTAGLSAAHNAGIAHRDLKPENVMVMRDGRVKILDFGLAKVSEALSDSLPDSPLTTVTMPGAIVGTPYYMSPEQASGGAVDFRSDQFSLGLILYEMATGVHPFRRETVVQTMSAIVADEAQPPNQLKAKVPTLLCWIIERCLSKDPADRYASTADLAKDVATLQSRLPEMSDLEVRPVPAVKRRRLRTALAIGGGVVFLTGAAAVVVPIGTDGMPPLKFTPLVTDARFQGAPAWSPDGTALAYTSLMDGIQQVFTKSLASSLSNQVTDSRFDSTDPFWSPDSPRIYYQSLAHDTESLWSISPAGGTPTLVIENAVRSTISPDGRTVVFLHDAHPPNAPGDLSLWVASPTGSDAHPYLEKPFDDATFTDAALRFSPDGSRLLVWVWAWTRGLTAPEDSHQFWVIPWPNGQPRRVLTTIARAAPATTSFDWLPDGRRIVVSLWDQATTGMHLWIVDVETGQSTQLTSTPASENRPVVAPNGRRVAFTSEAIDFDLVEIPLNGAPPRNLLATSRNELDPSVALNSGQYAYVSDKGGVLQIWIRSRDGQFERPIVGADQFPDGQTLTLGAPSLSPKGDRIAYQRYTDRSGYQIWISTVAAAGPPVRLTPGLPDQDASIYQDAPAWSPDGASIAFVSRTNDLRAALATVRIGAAERPEIISSVTPTPFSRPKWSPDGRWIVCDTSDGLVIVSHDGKSPRVVSQENWIANTWGVDSRTIYGLREADQARHFALSVLDIDTLKERVLNADLGIIPPASQPIRGLALLGAGSLVTSIASARSDIWVAEGLEFPRQTLLSRFWKGR